MHGHRGRPAAFDGYANAAAVARGPASVLFRVSRLSSGDVALKVFRPGGSLAEQAYARTWMLRDWRIWSELAHPHALAASDYGETNDALFVATPWLDGPSLRDVLDQRRTLEPAQIRELAGQLAGALDAAAAVGLVHLDVKPENVLFSSADGIQRAQVRDFGAGQLAAWKVGAGRSRTFRGTLEYAAPEQIGGGGVDRRTAVYSLGCLLYETLTGATPYAGRSHDALVRAHRGELPPTVGPGRQTWTACSPERSRRATATAMQPARSSRRRCARRSMSRLRRVRLPPPGAGVASGFAMRPSRRVSQSSRRQVVAAASWLPIGVPIGLRLPTRPCPAVTSSRQCRRPGRRSRLRASRFARRRPPSESPGRRQGHASTGRHPSLRRPRRPSSSAGASRGRRGARAERCRSHPDHPDRPRSFRHPAHARRLRLPFPAAAVPARVRERRRARRHPRRRRHPHLRPIRCRRLRLRLRHHLEQTNHLDRSARRVSVTRRRRLVRSRIARRRGGGRTGRSPDPGSQLFTDSTGEDPLAADINRVWVSNSAADEITVQIEITNAPTLDPDLSVDVQLDIDRANTTGRPSDGADFELAVSGATFPAPDFVRLLQWSGGGWQPVASTIHATYNTTAPLWPRDHRAARGDREHDRFRRGGRDRTRRWARHRVRPRPGQRRLGLSADVPGDDVEHDHRPDQHRWVDEHDDDGVHHDNDSVDDDNDDDDDDAHNDDPDDDDAADHIDGRRPRRRRARRPSSRPRRQPPRSSRPRRRPPRSSRRRRCSRPRRPPRRRSCRRPPVSPRPDQRRRSSISARTSAGGSRRCRAGWSSGTASASPASPSPRARS